MLPDRDQVRANKHEAVQRASFTVYIKLSAFKTRYPVRCRLCEGISCVIIHVCRNISRNVVLKTFFIIYDIFIMYHYMYS
jgi:hypothetical protein